MAGITWQRRRPSDATPDGGGNELAQFVAVESNFFHTLGRASMAALVLCSGFAATAKASDENDTNAFLEKVMAIDADPAYGAYLSSQCSTCHGSSGGQIPPLRGLPADYFITALHEYRTGIRTNDVMKTMAGGLSNEEIAALATYYADLDPQ
jgi:cytochrome c553